MTFQNNKFLFLLLVGFYSVFGYLWWTWTYFLEETPYYSEAIPEKGFFHYMVAYCASWAILLLFPPILGRAFGRLLKRMGGQDSFPRLLPVLNAASSVCALLSIAVCFLFLQNRGIRLSSVWVWIPLSFIPSFLFLTYGIMVGIDQTPVWWDYPIVDENLEKRSQRSQLFSKGHLPMITWCFIAGYLQFVFPVIIVGMICLFAVLPMLMVLFMMPEWFFSFTIEILVLFPGVDLAIYTYSTITGAALLWWIYFKDWRSHKQNLKKLRNE